MLGEHIDKRRLQGFLLFTVLYLSSLVSYRRFLGKTPEATGGIYALAIMSTIVYTVGLLLLLKLKRD